MIPEVYGSRSIRSRRTKSDLTALLQACQEVISSEPGQITIRHLFYRLVGRGAIAKSEREYKALGRHLMNWRRAGLIPWSAFADNTRWYYGSRRFDGIEAVLLNTRDAYRRNLWASQRAYVEIWAEKDAIASILTEEADSFGVKVLPLRGFASGTALYNAAEAFKAQIEAGKEVYVYYFGDFDPSGLAIDQSAIKALREDHEVDIHFLRRAVTLEQIERYHLPTRPTKTTDKRSKNFQGESVEIDSMDMGILRALVEESITQHINVEQWMAELEIEQQERLTLESISQLGVQLKPGEIVRHNGEAST